MLNVYFVDDDELIIEELIHIIEWKKYGFEICGYSTDSLKAKEEILSLRPTLVISDVQMAELDGLKLAKDVGEINNKINFCFLSVFDKFDYAIEAIRLGAIRYLKKPIRVNELIVLLEETKTKVLEKFSYELNSILFSESKDKKNLLCKLFDNSLLFKKDVPYRIVAVNNEKEIKFDFSSCCSSYELLYKDDTMQIYIMFELNAELLRSITENYDISLGISEESKSFELIDKYIKDARVLSKQKFITERNEFVIFEENSKVENLLKEIENTTNSYELKNILLHLKKNIIENNITVNYVQKIYTVIVYALIKHNIIEYNDTLVNLSVIYSYSSFDEMIQDLLINFDQSNIEEYNVSLFEEIKKDLENNISKKVSLSSYATKYGYNTSYFSQLFKKMFGTSFAEYLISLKIEKAKEMIASKNRLSLRSIASEVGYDDYYHFSKIFKKYTNYTPTEYKELIQND